MALIDHMRDVGEIVACQDCGAEDMPGRMVYQGKDGPEHTAPGSAFDYYLCQDCDAWYKRLSEVEDYEGDPAILCRLCGVLYAPGTSACQVCFVGDLIEVKAS